MLINSVYFVFIFNDYVLIRVFVCWVWNWEIVSPVDWTLILLFVDRLNLVWLTWNFLYLPWLPIYGSVFLYFDRVVMSLNYILNGEFTDLFDLRIDLWSFWILIGWQRREYIFCPIAHCQMAWGQLGLICIDSLKWLSIMRINIVYFSFC